MSHVSFDALPVECLANCLRFLPTPDLVRCRQVNKKLRFTVDHSMELTDLVIFLNSVPFKTIWFHSNQLVDLKRSLIANDLAFLRLKSVRWLFKSLKRLFVYGELLSGRTFDFRLLNGFTKLEHLEIHRLRLEPVDVSLARLKTFNYSRTPFPGERLARSKEINFLCPQLSSLQTLFGSHHFYYTNRVKHLQARVYHSSMRNFRSVEVIKLESLGDFGPDFLKNFSVLKELVFFAFDALLLDELKRQATVFALKQLRIFYLGIQFERAPSQAKISQIVDRSCLSSLNFDLYLSHWKGGLCEHIPFISRLDYGSHIAQHWSDLSGSFFRHFASVSTVSVKVRVQNVKLFLEFLAAVKCLNTLILKDSELPQSALDRLPAICESLSELVIDSRQPIDCSFITRLQHLVNIAINQSISFDAAHEILKKFRFIKSFAFLYANNPVQIVKKSERMFESNAFGICLQHNSLLNLITFLKYHNEVGYEFRRLRTLPDFALEG